MSAKALSVRLQHKAPSQVQAQEVIKIARPKSLTVYMAGVSGCVSVRVLIAE